MNMRKHALERHAATVRQLSNGANGDDLYMRREHFRQLTPPYEYECFWKSSEGKNRTLQHTDSTKLSVPGWDRSNNALVSILLSQRIIPPWQPGNGCNEYIQVQFKMCLNFYHLKASVNCKEQEIAMHVPDIHIS